MKMASDTSLNKFAGLLGIALNIQLEKAHIGGPYSFDHTIQTYKFTGNRDSYSKNNSKSPHKILSR